MLADSRWRLLVAVALCGANTTYSSYSFETFGMVEEGRYAVTRGQAMRIPQSAQEDACPRGITSDHKWPLFGNMRITSAQVQLDGTNVSAPMLEVKAESHDDNGWVSATAFGIQGHEYVGMAPTTIKLNAQMRGTIVNPANTGVEALGCASEVTGFSLGVWLLSPDPSCVFPSTAAALGEPVSSALSVSIAIGHWTPADVNTACADVHGVTDASAYVADPGDRPIALGQRPNTLKRAIGRASIAKDVFNVGMRLRLNGCHAFGDVRLAVPATGDSGYLHERRAATNSCGSAHRGPLPPPTSGGDGEIRDPPASCGSWLDAGTMSDHLEIDGPARLARPPTWGRSANWGP